MSADASSALGSLADSLGTTEAALRLLISLFLGYPFALVHWHYVSSWPPVVQNAYFAVSGFLIGSVEFGGDNFQTTCS
jgi:lysophospholipid acyltransferase 5